MIVAIHPHKFSLKETKSAQQISDFKKAFKDDSFIEIMDSSAEEAMELIVKFINEEKVRFENMRVLHIGDSVIFNKYLPTEGVYTHSLEEGKDTLSLSLKMNPHLILVKLDTLENITMEDFQDNYLTGHPVIFY